MDQISMFELLERKEPDFTGMTEAEVVDYVSTATGIKFKPDGYGAYKAKIKKVTYDIFVSRFNFEPYDPFIGVGYSTSTYGSSTPCDSLGEAIEFFNHYKRQEV